MGNPVWGKRFFEIPFGHSGCENVTRMDKFCLVQIFIFSSFEREDKYLKKEQSKNVDQAAP